MGLYKGFSEQWYEPCETKHKLCELHHYEGLIPGVKFDGGGSDMAGCQKASFLVDSTRFRFNEVDGFNDFGLNFVGDFDIEEDAVNGCIQ